MKKLSNPNLVTPQLPPSLVGEVPGSPPDLPLSRRISEPGLKDPCEGKTDDRASRISYMTKADIQQGFPRNFLGNGLALADLLDRDLVEVEHTAGTSEQRTSVLLPSGWWGEQERRALRLNLLVGEALNRQPDARRATLAPPVCSSDVCFTGVPCLSDRIVGSNLFVVLSNYPWLWDEYELKRMAEEVAAWQPVFLDLDPVYGVRFAIYCEQNEIHFPNLQFILSSYEFESVVHRRILRRVFKVPVFTLFGSTETGHLLMENETGRLVLSSQTASVQLLDPDADGIGELVVSTLSNEYMPLIRYRIGDLVQTRTVEGDSEYLLHGRVGDTLMSLAGNRITTRQMDQCLRQTSNIAHYEVRQHEDGSWQFRFVRDLVGPDRAELVLLRNSLEQLMGKDTCISIEETDLILPAESGKFRLSASV